MKVETIKMDRSKSEEENYVRKVVVESVEVISKSKDSEIVKNSLQSVSEILKKGQVSDF